MKTTSANTFAWHGDAQLKTDVLNRMRQHRAEDSIVQGLYQQSESNLATGYRGCLIGCTLPYYLPAVPEDTLTPDRGWHGAVEREYGIPRSVGHLLDDGCPARPAVPARRPRP